MMSFEMNVGARFGNSPDFKTYYNCAETYHCLKGEFTFHCPETGEVHVLRKGDTLYFPPNTWHWGYNFGSETCHILECLTPRTEEAVEAYAKKQPWLKDIRYGQREPIGKFTPGGARGEQRAQAGAGGRLSLRDRRREAADAGRPRLLDRHADVGIVDLHPGQESELIDHPGDKVLYCLAGRVNVYLPDETPNWWELNPGDAGFIPGGMQPRLLQHLGRNGQVPVRRRAEISLTGPGSDRRYANKGGNIAHDERRRMPASRCRRTRPPQFLAGWPRRWRRHRSPGSARRSPIRR